MKTSKHAKTKTNKKVRKDSNRAHCRNVNPFVGGIEESKSESWPFDPVTWRIVDCCMITLILSVIEVLPP